jgi:hypothetical protein
MDETVIINKEFRGPPEYGNGGYVCGVVAQLIGDAAEVTLRGPAPLEKLLKVQRLDEGGVVISDGDSIIAEGSPTTFDIDVPVPVSFEEAAAASKFYLGFEDHRVPTCFVCSPQVPEESGLHIYPSPIRERSIVATPWTPAARLGGPDGTVQSKFLWAVLDCPTGWALFAFTDFFGSPSSDPPVSGRFSGKIIEPVEVGQRCVVIGWPLNIEGRKGFAGSAIFSSNGDLHAVVRATWIRLKT